VFGLAFCCKMTKKPFSLSHIHKPNDIRIQQPSTFLLSLPPPQKPPSFSLSHHLLFSLSHHHKSHLPFSLSPTTKAENKAWRKLEAWSSKRSMKQKTKLSRWRLKQMSPSPEPEHRSRSPSSSPSPEVEQSRSPSPEVEQRGKSPSPEVEQRSRSPAPASSPELEAEQRDVGRWWRWENGVNM